MIIMLVSQGLKQFKLINSPCENSINEIKTFYTNCKICDDIKFGITVMKNNVCISNSG